MDTQTSAVQVSSSVLNVQKGRNTWPIDVPFVIADVDLYASHLLVRGQNHISVYQLNISNEKPVLKGEFPFECFFFFYGKVNFSFDFFLVWFWL